MERNLTDLEFFMSRWSYKTHTFVESRGESGPSLEDVAMLTTLPLVRQPHATNLSPVREDNKRIKFLTKSLLKSKYSTNKVAIYLSWAKYFDECGEGSNSPYQVKALLAYWLSYFV